MKKEIILLIIAIAIVLGFILPKPINTVVSLMILVPTTIYLIADTVKNGNKWKR